MAISSKGVPVRASSRILRAISTVSRPSPGARRRKLLHARRPVRRRCGEEEIARSREVESFVSCRPARFGSSCPSRRSRAPRLWAASRVASSPVGTVSQHRWRHRRERINERPARPAHRSARRAGPSALWRSESWAPSVTARVAIARRLRGRPLPCLELFFEAPGELLDVARPSLRVSRARHAGRLPSRSSPSVAASARAKPGNRATGSKCASARSCSASKLTRAVTASAPSAVPAPRRAAPVPQPQGAQTSCMTLARCSPNVAPRARVIPLGDVIRRVAGRADDQDLRRGRKALDEGVGGAEPLGVEDDWNVSSMDQ